MTDVLDITEESITLEVGPQETIVLDTGAQGPAGPPGPTGGGDLLAVNNLADVNSIPQALLNLGLDQVDNTSDADKPISTATQSALDNKSNTGHGHGISEITGLQAQLDAKINKGPVQYVDDQVGADDMTRFIAAITNAADGDTVKFNPGQTYDVDRLVQMRVGQDVEPKNIHIDATGAKFRPTASAAQIRMWAEYTAPLPLAANYVAGSDNILVDVSSIPDIKAQYARGDHFFIISNAVDPRNTNRGADPLQHRLGEQALIRQVEDPSETGITNQARITFWGPLEYTDGLSGELTPADPDNRTSVNTYDLAQNPRIFTSVQKDFSWTGGEFFVDVPFANVGQGGWNLGSVLNVLGFFRPKVNDVEFDRIPGSGLVVNGAYDPLISQIRANGLPDIAELLDAGVSITDPFYIGYPVALSGVEGGSVDQLHTSDTRHGIDGNSAVVDIDETNQGRLGQYCRVRGTRVTNFVGTNQFSASIAIHHGTDRWTFVAPSVTNNLGEAGIFVRGNDHIIIEPNVDNCFRGVGAFSDFADSDGHPGLSGKGDQYVSSCTIVGGNIRSRTQAIIASNARVKVVGSPKIKQNTHYVFAALGGTIDVAGDIDLEITGTEAADTVHGVADYGIFTSTAANAAYGVSYEPGTFVRKTGNIVVNAVAAQDDATNMKIVSSPATCGFRLDGRLEVDGNANFDFLFDGAGTRRISHDAHLILDNLTALPDHERTIEAGRIQFDIDDDQILSPIRIPNTNGNSGILTIFTDASANAAQVIVSDPVDSGSNAEFIAFTNEPVATAVANNIQLASNVDLNAAGIATITDGRMGVTFRDGIIWFGNRYGRTVTVSCLWHPNTDLRY